jgi:enamine deaminase RidA (YjgF/YER057c/UK114 family)
MGRIESRIADLRIVLPEPVAPVATYAPFVFSQGLVFISGQISAAGGRVIVGRLGADLDLEDGVRAARACGLNLLAQLKAATGDLDRVRRVVKLGAFVASTPEFFDHPTVANGASDLMVAIFGEAGRHARAAVGAPGLPLGAAVEIDGIFEVD